MIRKIAAAILLAASLGGCSYGYDLIVAVRNGQVAIEVDPASPHQPLCLRRIQVSEENGGETAWLESISFEDDCANKFPLRYGVPLRGLRQPDTRQVAAKSLRQETIYVVAATTGATGYGSGRFFVHLDGRIENLPAKRLPSGTASGR